MCSKFYGFPLHEPRIIQVVEGNSQVAIYEGPQLVA